MKLIVVKTFDDAISAHILKNSLEGEGIECFIHDENIVTIDPLYNFAVGGIKLKVAEENVAKAKSKIEEIEFTPFKNKNGDVIICPNCQSDKLFNDFKSIKNPGGIIATIISFFFVVFPIYFKSLFRCKSCGTEFEVKK